MRKDLWEFEKMIVEQIQVDLRKKDICYILKQKDLNDANLIQIIVELKSFETLDKVFKLIVLEEISVDKIISLIAAVNDTKFYNA